MSFKGAIEAQCPNGCEPFGIDIWSYIRGDQSPDLRLAALCREVNLLLCPRCETPFIPPEPYIYYDPRSELLAFVFPESYREKEDYWRGKMHEDFLAMKEGLGPGLPLDLEPELFFGPEGLGKLLEEEEYRGEETEVMEHYARELGLALYRVGPRFARERRVPTSLPHPAGSKPTRESVIAGLERLLTANDRLTFYAEFLAQLKAGEPLPPPPQAPPRDVVH